MSGRCRAVGHAPAHAAMAERRRPTPNGPARPQDLSGRALRQPRVHRSERHLDLHDHRWSFTACPPPLAHAPAPGWPSTTSVTTTVRHSRLECREENSLWYCVERRRPTVTRKKRARKQKVCDDQFLRYVSALVKNASAGKKSRLTKYQATSVQQRVHRLVLDRLPLAEIKRRIAHFHTLSFESMTYEDIEKAVADVVFVDAVDSEKVAVLSWITDYRNPGLLLYRARKDTIPLELASDCWSPPPEKARPSRLNREGEPLLYTSADGPKVVIDEIGAKPGEAISIIVYSIRERLKLMVLGSTNQYPYLDEAQRQKQAHLFAFLSSQFVRTVPQGVEHLYMISQVIAREHWGIYGDHNGWLYPSIKSGTYHNVALEPG